MAEEPELHMTLQNSISRNGKSFCIYEQFLAFRNLKNKCFEIIDVETKQSQMTFAYEDQWYYNNYHVLGPVFVFPHSTKVSFFDSSDKFRQLNQRGLEIEWYKNEED